MKSPMRCHVFTSPSSVWPFLTTFAYRHPHKWWMESFYPITCLLTAGTSSAADCLDPQMAKQLEDKIFHHRSHTFSENNKVTYHTHRNSYLHFCQHMGYPPVPAQPAHLCHYAAFLARTLKATSIALFHTADMLSPRRTKAFFFARLNSFSSFSLRDWTGKMFCVYAKQPLRDKGLFQIILILSAFCTKSSTCPVLWGTIGPFNPFLPVLSVSRVSHLLKNFP